MKMKKLCMVVAVMAAVFLLGLGVASATLIPVNLAVTPTGPNFTYSYRIDQAADQGMPGGQLAPVVNPVSNLNLAPSPFVTLYDFNGYVPGSAVAPAGWTISVQNTGFTPSDVSPVDDAGIVNITFAYTGATAQQGALSFAGFSAVSTIGLATSTDSFTARDFRFGGMLAGTVIDNVGLVTGPTPSRVPVPPTALLLGSSLVGLVGLRWKLRR